MKKLTHGHTTCRRCKHTIGDASFETTLGIVEFTGPTRCAQCGRGYEPEDFTPNGQAPNENTEISEGQNDGPTYQTYSI